MKVQVLWLLAAVAVGLMLLGCSLPRKSDATIRKHILSETPKGSSYASVRQYAKKQGWPTTEQPTGLETKALGLSPQTVIGKRTIKAYLGGYRGLPWWKDVNCYWAFDDQDRLIDVFIDKIADAP